MIFLEVFFGETADWLKDNTGVAGGFIGWQGSTVVISVVLMIVGGLIVAYWDKLSDAPSRVVRGKKAIEPPETDAGLSGGGGRSLFRGRDRGKLRIDDLEASGDFDQVADVSDDASFESKKAKINPKEKRDS